MSRASTSSRHSTIKSSLSISKGETTSASSTRMKVESVTKKMPRLTISSSRYLGPGYSSFSTPYKFRSRTSSCRDSTATSSKMSPIKKQRRPKTVTSKDEMKAFLNEQPLKRAKVHKSILKVKEDDDKIKKTNDTILEILRQAEEGNKRRKKESLAPYLQVIPENSIASDKTEHAEEGSSITPLLEKLDSERVEKAKKSEINEPIVINKETKKKVFSLFKYKRNTIKQSSEKPKDKIFKYTALDVLRKTFQKKPRNNKP